MGQLQTRAYAAPTAKLRLAALRHLFDWLVTGQVVPLNPAASVRGPAHSVRTGKTAARQHRCQHLHRAARQSADRAHGLQLRADRRGACHAGRGRLRAKPTPLGPDTRERRQAARDALPPHARGVSARLSGRDRDRRGCEGPLFRTIGRGTGRLTRIPLPQANAYAMVQRRALTAAIGTRIGNHSFRATGITAYLKNGGTLENAAVMANHASTRTMQLYDRRRDDITLDKVERIGSEFGRKANPNVACRSERPPLFGHKFPLMVSI